MQKHLPKSPRQDFGAFFVYLNGYKRLLYFLVQNRLYAFVDMQKRLGHND